MSIRETIHSNLANKSNKKQRSLQLQNNIINFDTQGKTI